VLQPQDIALCESVQRGLSSRSENQGARFATETEFGEDAVHHFQLMVASALGVDRES